MIDEGVINYWGTSWWPPHLVERTIGLAKLLGAHPPCVEQPPYHMTARFIEPDLFDVANYHRLGIVAFEALALGFFTGKYRKGNPKDSLRAKIQPYPQATIDKYAERFEKLDEIIQELGITMPQLALAWVLRKKEVSTTLMGASNPEQVVENAGASGTVISDEISNQIEEIMDSKPKFEYRGNILVENSKYLFFLLII